MSHLSIVSSSRILLSCTLLVLFASSGTAGSSWNVGVSGIPAGGEDQISSDLRLAKASFQIDVLGPVATGVLVQQFANEADQDVLAAYTGAAPRGLRVTSIVADLGGEIVDLQSSDDIDEPASRTKGRNEAKTAPEVRKIVVEAGQTINVRTSFQTSLSLSEGRFKLRLPAVGHADETVPGGIHLTVHHDTRLLQAESPTHDVLVSYQGNNSLVELAGGEETSREFEFEFAMGVEDDSTLLSFAGPERDGVRDVVMVLSPPMTPRDETVRPKQVLFVLDTSGSMAKETKLEQARLGVASCLDKLRTEDQFNIVEFDAAFSLLSEEPVTAVDGAQQRAKSWLMAQRAGGSTRLLPALAATLEQPEAKDLHRMIVVLTDGMWQDTRDVLELLKTNLGEGRLFVVGIGEEVNRKSILALAEFGRGTATFAADPQELEAAVTQLFDSVAEPLAWDLEIDWGGADVESVEPERMPDLYAGRPVTVYARVRGDLPTELKVGASTMDGNRLMISTLDDSSLTELPRPSRPVSGQKQRSGRR